MKGKLLSGIMIIVLGVTILLAAGCSPKPSEKDYGVFIGLNADQIQKASDYKTIVIDADYFTKQDINDLHKNGQTVYSYLNVGSVENFRDYYDEYKDIALGPYKNWEKEEWVDVSKKGWQQHIQEQAKSYLDKGIDGFFIDNCDVYYVYPREEIYGGLAAILESLNMQKKEVLINGGNTFVTEYLKRNGTTDPILDGVNQETVYTTIDFEHNTFGQSDQETQDYYTSYFSELMKDGRRIYLLEYTKDAALTSKIMKVCQSNGWYCYVSKSLELN